MTRKNVVVTLNVIFRNRLVSSEENIGYYRFQWHFKINIKKHVIS